MTNKASGVAIMHREGIEPENRKTAKIVFSSLLPLLQMSYFIIA